MRRKGIKGPLFFVTSVFSHKRTTLYQQQNNVVRHERIDKRRSLAGSPYLCINEEQLSPEEVPGSYCVLDYL